MLLGDGSWNENSNSASYWTSSKNLADDMMRLCLHCGYSGYLWSGYPDLRSRELPLPRSGKPDHKALAPRSGNPDQMVQDRN